MGLSIDNRIQKTTDAPLLPAVIPLRTLGAWMNVLHTYQTQVQVPEYHDEPVEQMSAIPGGRGAQARGVVGWQRSREPR